MSFFDRFDEDKLLSQVLPRLNYALESWLNGMAADEVSLMNQITSEFNSKRARTCDIGISESYSVSSELFELHRRGTNQVDKFGADLAFTIETPDFTKTAFFQFKIAKNNIARVETKQIDDAKIISEVYERSFVFTVDRNSGKIRITPVSDIAEEFVNLGSKGLDIDKWEAFSEWLLNWLRCKRGKLSDNNDRKKIENLLDNCSISSRRDRFGSYWELPEKYLPAKSWLDTSIKLKENKNLK